ncbi:MAG: hypothetical protein WAS73_01515 [Defluviicoccus sp.]
MAHADQDAMKAHRPARRWAAVSIVAVIGLTGLVCILASTILEFDGQRSMVSASLSALGGLLFIGSTVSFVSDYVIKESMLREFKRTTDDSLREFKQATNDSLHALYKETTEFFDRAVCGSSKYGMDGFVDEADFGALINGMQPGDTLLWLDTYAPGFPAWINHVKRKAQSGCTFRFLALKPGCSMAKLRAEELGPPYNTEKDNILRFDRDLASFIDDIKLIGDLINKEVGKSCIEIRLYDDLLGAPTYIVESNGCPKYGISSVYLGTATGQSFPHFRWRLSGDSPFIKHLATYFHKKWGNCSGA